MEEQVAQALAKESGVSDWAHVSEHGEYDSRDYWRRLARTAIVTIRVTTEPMVRAMLAACPGRDPGPFVQAWYAMIDATLSPSAQDPR